MILTQSLQSDEIWMFGTGQVAATGTSLYFEMIFFPVRIAILKITHNNSHKVGAFD